MKIIKKQNGAGRIALCSSFATSPKGLCERPLRYELYQCKPHWRLWVQQLRRALRT